METKTLYHTAESFDRITDTTVELDLLSNLFFRPDDIYKTKEISSDDFFSSDYAKAFDILKTGYLNGKKSIDLALEVKRETGIKLSEIARQEIVSTEFCVEEIKRNSIYRKAKEKIDFFCESIKSSPKDYKGEISKLEANLMAVSRRAEEEKTDIKSIFEEIEEMQMELEAKRLKGKKYMGIETGYEFIDRVIEGLMPGHIWVIGAYTNTGKSAFLLNIINNVLLGGNKASVYSLEMTKAQILIRMLGINSGKSGLGFIKDVSDRNYAEYQEIKKKMENFQLKVHTNYFDLDKITMSIYEESKRENFDVFAIDFLQNIRTGRKTEYESITYAVTELQNLAREIKKPIITLSQINNESAKSMSQVMGFKGSGTIAHVADLGIELKREKTQEEIDQILEHSDNYEIKCIIRKNRHGLTGYSDLLFNPYTGAYKTS